MTFSEKSACLAFTKPCVQSPQLHELGMGIVHTCNLAHEMWRQVDQELQVILKYVANLRPAQDI